MAIKFFVEKIFVDVEAECGQSHQERGEFLHFRIVSRGRRRKALRLERPQIRYEIISTFGTRVVRLAWPAFPAGMVGTLGGGGRPLGIPKAPRRHSQAPATRVLARDTPAACRQPGELPCASPPKAERRRRAPSTAVHPLSRRARRDR